MITLDRDQIIKMFHEKGFTIIPVDDAKEPLIKWKDFQKTKPTLEQIMEWDKKFNKPNFAVINGHISNGLVIIDFENINDAITFFGPEKFEELKKKTLVVQTPHNGIHVCAMEKTKMPNRHTKIFGEEHPADLLGEGGYALIPGSKIDHSKCKPEKPCDHKSIGEYKIISTTTDIITSEDIENEIKERAKELGWKFTIDEKEKKTTIQSVDQIINDLKTKNKKFERLMEGNTEGYPSRSEAEEAVITILVSELLSDEQIYEIMNKCKIGKWQEEDENYRTRTIRNAREWLRQKKLEEETKKQNEEIQKKEIQDEINSIISKLHPETWYDVDENGKTIKFNLQNATDDFIKANPNIITEYTGLIHVSTSKGYQKDSENFIKSIFEKAGNVPPEQLNRIVEVIRHKTMIIDPKLIGKPLEEIYPVPEHLIPIENGLLDIHEKKVYPHDPKYYYVSHIPRNYIPGAKAEKFREFLNIIFKDDPEKDTKITQIYEIFAWGIYPKYLPHGAIIFLGSGGEGKSIIHTVLEKFFVETTSVTVKELETDKFKRAELYGKFINAVSEAGEGFVKSEWFKRTSDFTQILADRKNAHPFLFRSRAKWVIDTNILPIFKEDINALYRRVIKIISFNNYLEHLLTPKQIDEYVNEITTPEELDKLFSEVIDDYYLPFIDRKKFTGQYTLEEAQENYQRIVNPANAYIEDRIDHDAILTDINEVKEYLQNNNLPEEYFTAKEKKNNKEHIILIKQFVEADAKAWAKEQKLPVDLIDTKNIGSALGKHGYNGIISIKKKIKESNFNAWRDIFIIPHDIKNYLSIEKSIIDDENRTSTRSAKMPKITGTAPNVSAENTLEAISTSESRIPSCETVEIRDEKEGTKGRNKGVTGTEGVVGISSTDRRGSTSDLEGSGTAGIPPNTLNRENSQIEPEKDKENKINKIENICKTEGPEDQGKGQTPDQDIAYHGQKQVILEKQILWYKSDNFYDKEYFEQFKARLNRYFEYEMSYYYELEIPENSLSDDRYKIFTSKAHEIDFQEFENMRGRSKEVKK